MYVEAYKTSSQKLYFFFLVMRLFPYVNHRSLRAVISYQATMAKEQEYL